MTEAQTTVLLVEDEVVIRELAASVLESAGYRVLNARHSDEALILLDGFPGEVQLLLTDVKMDPFMNGCELAKCTRMMRPKINVLYISGLKNNAMVQQEVEELRATFLAKPFTPQALLEKVRSVIVDRLPA